MKQNKKGVSPLPMIGLLLFGLIMILTFMKDPTENYTREEFIADVEDGLVLDVTIQPNAETPTGYLEVNRRTGDKKLYVTDVAEAEKMVREYGFDPQIKDVPRDRLGLSTLFPMLIVLIVGFFLFMMISAQHASGGANGKMMNFGKSRARLFAGDNKTNFSLVAGLKEEKEELHLRSYRRRRGHWRWPHKYQNTSGP